jgi:hypothetical protein
MVVMKKSHASQFSSRSSISALAQQANQVTFPRCPLACVAGSLPRDKRSKIKVRVNKRLPAANAPAPPCPPV